MRFSNSNTFYGDPIADITQWATVIQQNVQRDQLTHTQPAVFCYTNPQNGAIWWVEVTLTDYLSLFPDPVVVQEFMEMDNEPMTVDQQVTNTYGLDDNCHYVTAAALLGITTEELFQRIETMQGNGDTEDPEISELFTSAGLSGVYHEYASFALMEQAIVEFADGADRRFAVSFGRADGSGHVVVGEYNAMTETTQYLDYQQGEGEDAAVDVAAGTEFALYPQ